MIPEIRNESFRLEARNRQEKTWRVILEFDEAKRDRYRAIVDATSKNGEEVLFRIVPSKERHQ